MIRVRIRVRTRSLQPIRQAQEQICERRLPGHGADHHIVVATSELRRGIAARDRAWPGCQRQWRDERSRSFQPSVSGPGFFEAYELVANLRHNFRVRAPDVVSFQLFG